VIGATTMPLGRPVRTTLLALTAVLAALAMLASAAGSARGASLSTSKAKSAVVSYVKRTWGSSYAVHPACYKLTAKRSKCFVHMVHGSTTCTKYATVTLKGRRAVVSMKRPSC
jgi:hypothetical protein